MIIDDDILEMAPDECRLAFQELRDFVREYRDAEGHERCHVTAAALFSLLPEKKACRYNVVTDENEFLSQCRVFHSEDLFNHLHSKGMLPCQAKSDPP